MKLSILRSKKRRAEYFEVVAIKVKRSLSPPGREILVCPACFPEYVRTDLAVLDFNKIEASKVERPDTSCDCCFRDFSETIPSSF